MPFVKLDVGILSSTLWIDRVAREVFITALLMAEPRELAEPFEQITTDRLDLTGWSVPPGWYGWVDAAGVGILARAGIEREPGIDALKRLAAPDDESRSKRFDGRRLVRVDGGYIVLNYIEYRDRDYTSAIRSKRWRARQKMRVSQHRDDTPDTALHPPTDTPATRDTTPSRSRSRSRVHNQRSVQDTGSQAQPPGSVQTAAPAAADARSKRPIFKGTRFVVFDWMLDDLRKMLGAHTDDFDLHAWFFRLNQLAEEAGIVVPQRDSGVWLQQQTLEEAIRRGLPVATTQRPGKTAGNAAALTRFVERRTV